MPKATGRIVLIDPLAQSIVSVHYGANKHEPSSQSASVHVLTADAARRVCMACRNPHLLNLHATSIYGLSSIDQCFLAFKASPQTLCFGALYICLLGRDQWLGQSVPCYSLDNSDYGRRFLSLLVDKLVFNKGDLHFIIWTPTR